MHYKLVVGVQVCLGQWVTKIKRQNDKDKKKRIKKQNEIYNIIYMWHKFIKINLSMFDLSFCEIINIIFILFVDHEKINYNIWFFSKEKI